MVGAKSATPEIIAHEYRHKQQPGLSEQQNRVADGSSALNERQWKSAVNLWRDQLARNGHKVTPSEAERSLIKAVDNKYAYNQTYVNELRDGGANLPESKRAWYNNDMSDYEKMRKEQVYWPKRKAELDEFDSWVRGLEERNEERESFKRKNRPDG